MRAFILILLVAAWTINPVHAQLFKKKETYTVYINTVSSNERAEVLSNKEPVKVVDSLVYYWYSSNKIVETKGGFDGKLLHGQYSSFYLNNQLMEKGMYDKGIKQGKWRAWFDTGVLKEISNWKNGSMNGEYKKYNDKGQLVLSATYKNGKYEGVVTRYEDGKIIAQKNYKAGMEIPMSEVTPKWYQLPKEWLKPKPKTESGTEEKKPEIKKEEKQKKSKKTDKKEEENKSATGK